MTAPLSAEVRVLEQELRDQIDGEVRFDAGTKALYATDASNYRQIPIGVVIPRSVDAVMRTVEICRSHGAPVLGRGAGTSIAGQSCNAAVVLDFSKYLNRVLEIDWERRLARVEPGTILDDLRSACEERHFTFGPDPATHDRCTIGGMLGNNSCGIHSVMAGRTSDNVESLEILTYDGLKMNVGPTCDSELRQIIESGGRRGEIYAGLRDLRDQHADLIRSRYPHIPRRVSGYNLDDLLPENGFNVARALIGSEGTCVTILSATLRIIPSPQYRRLLVLGYPNVYVAADDVPAIMKWKPTGLEGMDDYLRNFLQAKRGLRPEETHLLPEGTGWLLVEFGGETPDEAEQKARALMDCLSKRSASRPSMKLTTSREEKLVWDVRKSGLGATAFLPGGRNTWPGWEDAAVPPDRLGEYLREFTALRDRFGYESAMYGHFGEGCVHMRIDFDMFTEQGVQRFVHFMEEAADLVIRFGGSLSGEHGDGQARGHLLPRMFGDELVEAFRKFKRIWDPEWKMNPGKKIDPFGVDEHLKFGPQYHPTEPKTEFSYFESNRRFLRAIHRCVGVGRCRHLEGGTMCPSFMVTREEKHSTRGRSRLLEEMLRGDVIGGGWRSQEVKDALELCLSCKGCKGDCPVNVDMATYKSEFLAHYYEGRMRPLAGYATGMIFWWARAASIAPQLANMATHAPLLSSAMKRVFGIHPERRFPRFAPQTFRRWHRSHTPPREARRGRVLLWADTFNNYFLPATAQAALNVLETAGWEVMVRPESLCCGRPLYDQGMLGLARRLLLHVLRVLRPEIEAGTPVIVLEPSCAAVFRDELVNLFPDDPLAQRLASQVVLFGEFLHKHLSEWSPPPMHGDALYHAHCHQKALFGSTPDLDLLRQIGLQVDSPETGCCGMAGGFGFHRDKYRVSVEVAERVLLPKVRASSLATLIVTDGFSCREQIAQLAGREALHLAQVIDKALSAPIG